LYWPESLLPELRNETVPICSQAVLWISGNWLDSGTTWWLNVVGRLKPRGTLSQATARLKLLSHGLFQSPLPANYPRINIEDYLNFKLTAVPLCRRRAARRGRNPRQNS
jgi:hypothetical protein